ncbi:MAG: helix-turn-helix transcriptional regulator [Parvibaculum sp.]
MSTPKPKNGKAPSPQIIRGPEGDALYALVPMAQYERMKRAADDIADIKATADALLGDRVSLVPAEIVHRIADGENPVRVWREYRGLKGVELARAAGISPAYLSEIETGKKDGTFRTMTHISHCLQVPLDDLAPVADEDDRVEREQTARVNRIRAQIRMIEDLIVGPVDFNTGAVRQAAGILAADATAMLQEDDSADEWLAQVLTGVEEIIDLVDRAEGDIIETARSTRDELERVVMVSTFRAPLNKRAAV